MSEQEQSPSVAKTENNPKKEFIGKLLNKTMKVKITDGRTLIGTFLCTDSDANIVLGSCLEYVNFDSAGKSFHERFRLTLTSTILTII